MREALKSRKEPGALINEGIKFDKVHLIDHEGTNHGVVSRSQALAIARGANLDLVLIAEQGKEGFPVAKVMDYGKMLYAKKKQQAVAKKHQKVIQIKEIKIRPNIAEHDYKTKINQGIEFLRDGKKLKVTLMFRGREVATKNERGQMIYDKITHSFEEASIAEQVIIEKDIKSGNLWSRIYYMKK